MAVRSVGGAVAAFGGAPAVGFRSGGGRVLENALLLSAIGGLIDHQWAIVGPSKDGNIVCNVSVVEDGL